MTGGSRTEDDVEGECEWLGSCGVDDGPKTSENSRSFGGVIVSFFKLMDKRERRVFF